MVIINRKQKRTFIKQSQKRGISKDIAEAYIAIREPNQIQEGDMVKLDVKKIKGYKGYKNMNPKYREFVEANADAVFTAHLEKRAFISLKEQPEWLFWCGDIIKVKGETGCATSGKS